MLSGCHTTNFEDRSVLPWVFLACLPATQSSRARLAQAKIKDEFVNRELEKRGWKVLVAWEHEFKTNKDIVGEKLDLMLGSASGVSE